MAEDYFFAAAEPDVNHPDYNKSERVVVTEVNIDDNDTLYIYVPQENMPPNRFHKELEHIQKKFNEAMPNTTVICGGYDLKFTTITKKQEFKAKLDGTL